MNDTADNSVGASSGNSAIVRAAFFSGMHERVSAYANVNAIGTTIIVTSAPTVSECSIERSTPLSSR